jgi:single-stranded DNA-binding protein
MGGRLLYDLMDQLSIISHTSRGQFMQAYANVGTAPTRHTAKASGKTYWEFRASESARGEDKNPTWYTVRIFKEEDPQLKKGDFVVFTGKLKNDVFMGRDGKPMGVLTVLAFNLQKVVKDGKRETIVDAPQAAETAVAATEEPAKAPVRGNAPVPTAASAPVSNLAPAPTPTSVAVTIEAPTQVAAAVGAPHQAKPLFAGFCQSWGMTPQTLRYGT